MRSQGRSPAAELEGDFAKPGPSVNAKGEHPMRHITVTVLLACILLGILLALFSTCDEALGKVAERAGGAMASKVSIPDPCGETSDVPRLSNGLDLEYTLTISNPASEQAHMSVKVSNVAGPSIVFYFPLGYLGVHEEWVQPANNISVPVATDGSSAELPVQIVTLEDGRDGFQVDVGSASTVHLDYDVSFGFVRLSGDPSLLWGGYLGPEFGITEPPLIFLVPPDEDAVSSMKAKLSVPSSWNVLTWWPLVGEYYLIPDYAALAGQVNDWLGGAPLGFGEFHTFEQAVGGTSVEIAVFDYSYSDAQDIANTAFDIFDYHYATYGVMREEPFLRAFVPGPVGGYYLRGLYDAFMNLGWNEWSWHVFAHEMQHSGWHQWFKNSPVWLTEGFTAEWYAMRACLAADVYTEDKMHEMLASRLFEYEAIAGTDKDMSIHEGGIRFHQQDPDAKFIVYQKAWLVAYMLDQVLEDLSPGGPNLADVYAHLVAEFGLSDRIICHDDILDAVNLVSGYDFTCVFDNYVYGEEILPLEYRDGRMEVDFSALPPTGQPLDADEDMLSICREILAETDPNESDTDSDGLEDGTELLGIVIDGKDQEDYVLSRFEDSAGDSLCEVDGTEIVALAVGLDNEALYLRLEVAEEPAAKRYDFQLYTDATHYGVFVGEFSPRSVSLFNWNTDEWLDPNSIVADIDEVVEVRIPFSEIGNPAEVTVRPETRADVPGHQWEYCDHVEAVLQSLTQIRRIYTTDPLNPDTDGDGFSDGTEVRVGTNPLDPNSHPYTVNIPLVIRSQVPRVVGGARGRFTILAMGLGGEPPSVSK